MTCEHLEFDAHVNVHRITLANDGPVKSILAELTVRCRQCKCLMNFKGAPVGLSYAQPTCDLSGNVVSLPMWPDGEVYDPEGLVGFSVHAKEGQ